ncbi:MAG TPA: serine/threonine-protein kinase [Anaerolineaceae bacterium]|nr:serine/threonine-protein kinase [Anaerolineaceae bacterium]HPN52922.1 serine/threonine-protein kinase [Anaerolineaceae bacterium]
MTQNLPGQEADKQLISGELLVNRYLIQNVIGVGGMGSVYRARDMHFPSAVRLVAVKEMINHSRDALVRQTIVQNFEREANILVSLSHPAVPRIFDYFTHEDRSYLVMECVNGKDLEAILSESQGFFPEDQVIEWAIQLCDVLQYLHTHKPEPIIFRDMKPSNVMVNQYNQIILIDFGIAKAFKFGQKGTMIGTEGYSPPEQYRGEASPLVDIYALGATLHHLITRRDPRVEPPFTFAERPIRQINPAISIELEAVINTALQYNPTERFQTAEAMKEALMNVARKTGALTRISMGTSSIAAAPSTIKPLWTFECEDQVRGSVAYDGGYIYVGSYDNNLYTLQADNGKFIWKYPTDGGIVSKPIVYDGVVYFGSEDHRVHSVSVRSGKIISTYYTDGPVRSSPRIAEGHIFVGSDDGFLHAVNLLSNRRAWRVEASGPVRSTPFITNEQVFFGCESGEVFCVDFRGQVKWRFKAKRAVTSSPVVSQGAVFFTSLDAQIYAVDAKSGWVTWRFRMGKGSLSSPCRVDNLVIFGSADGIIYCLDAGNAKEIWRYQTDHQVSGSPLIYKDSVYCGSADGYMYCLEYRTGRLRWKFQTGAPITAAPVINSDVLYFGSNDHIVYAIPV